VPAPPPQRGGKTRRARAAAAAAGLVLALSVAVRPFVSGPARYPRHVGPVPPVKDSDLAAPALPPGPRAPSVRNLPAGVPRKVGGLEAVPAVYEPALSGDLRTIVFTTDRGGGGPRDVWIAVRESPESAFGKPAPVEPVGTPADERSPTLSRDALELVFVRDGRPMAAARGSASGPFRAPTPLELPGCDRDAEAVDDLRLSPDDMYLTFRVSPRRPSGRGEPRYLLAWRPARGAPFEEVSPLPVWSPLAVNAFSPDLCRNYVATGEGVAVSSRAGLAYRFGLAGLIQTLTPSRVGPVDDGFWIAPKEDVMFYSSPGPRPHPGLAKPLGSGRPDGRAGADTRSLWMVRFR
jgi:hypothetical protein